MPAILAGIIAISLNSGAYVAEIIRSGIQSINKGQSEAARSLGLSQKMTFQYVVMPQALKNIWPALGNEFKDSGILRREDESQWIRCSKLRTSKRNLGIMKF